MYHVFQISEQQGFSNLVHFFSGSYADCLKEMENQAVPLILFQSHAVNVHPKFNNALKTIPNNNATTGNKNNERVRTFRKGR